MGISVKGVGSIWALDAVDGAALNLTRRESRRDLRPVQRQNRRCDFRA